MRKYVSFISVPAVNMGAIVYAQYPALDLFEALFKLLLLVATFVFTVVRIFLLLRNKRDKEFEDS